MSDVSAVKAETPAMDGKSPFGLPEKESECYRKLILVLLKILQPNFKTSDDSVLEKLLDFMRTQGKHSEADLLVLCRILSEWLKKVTENWTDLSTRTKIFALKVAGFVTSHPAGHCRLSSSGVLLALFSFLKSEKSNSSSITLGFLCVLEATLSNPDGCLTVIHTGLWHDVTLMAMSSSSIYCLRKSTKLLSEIIMRCDDSITQAIFKDVTACCPVKESSTPRNEPKNLVIFDESGPVSKKPSSSGALDVVKTMNLCHAVISNLMDGGYPAAKIMELVRFCHLTDWAWNVLETGTNKKISEAANRLVCILNALHFYQSMNENGLIPLNIARNVHDLILKYFNILCTRRMWETLANASSETYKYLVKYGGLVAGDKEREPQGKEIENIPFCLHNVLFLYQALPILLCVKARSPTFWSDILEDFADKIFRFTDSKCMRLAYYMRDNVILLGEQLCNHATACVHRFMDMAPIMRKEQAVLLFQALTHVLNEFTAESQDVVIMRSVRKFNMEGDELISAYPNFLSAIINCQYTYLNLFDFSWRDGLESLCLMIVLQKLLDSPSTTPSITVDILKTINVVLVKFMPANLALLVDTIKGSSIEDLGPQLFKLLHSKEWSVKDSTLETVKTIASLSESRFPAFQTLLIDNQLPQIVVSMMESEVEPFVRRTAITCILELAKVPNVWQATIADKNVMEKLLLTLLYETEGIVRSEAAKTITVIYQQNICPNKVELMYDVMSHVAQNDFHWEVKLRCLDFWRSVMSNSIGQQGVIDGAFPEAVFSKEKKKIIKITPEEIKHRIMAAFNTLEVAGCLQVLWATFYNEEDLAVQSKSAEMINKIFTCPRRYHVQLTELESEEWTSQNGHSTSEPSSTILIRSNADISNISSLSQEVNGTIDQILAETDAELLQGLINHTPVKRTLPSIKRIIMSKQEFSSRLASIDVEKVIEDRTKWLADTSEGISSLLDDILLFSSSTDQINNRNAVDCY